MRTFFSLIFLFLGNSVFCQSAGKTSKFNYIVNYKLSYKPNEMQRNYSVENYTLFANNDAAIFRPSGFAILDTIKLSKQYQNLSPQQRTDISVKYTSDVNDIILINLKTNIIDYTVFVLAASSFGLRYTETIKPRWRLINKADTINGINCNQASLSIFGRTWTAWYSTQLPLHFGPYKFFGLPGLIIKVEDDSKSYVFEMYSIKKREHVQPMVVHENVQTMDKAAAVKLYNVSRFSMQPWSSNNVKLDPEVYKKVLEYQKSQKARYTNPIELKPLEYY